MSFLAPAGLFALIALPIVVGLHLLRRRLPERRVAGLFLWPAEAVSALSGRRRSRLLQTPSLWLELLAAAALALVLSRLSLGAYERATHLVVVLDDSASMSAGTGEARTEAKARRAVEAELATLSAASLVTIVTTGPRPKIVLGPKAPRDLAKGALDAWHPRLPRHDPAPALQLAAQLLAQEHDRALFVTDEPPESLAGVPATVAVRAVGTRLLNRAIIAARRERGGDPGEERVFADLMLFAEAAGDVELVARSEDSAGTVLARKTVRLAPGPAVHEALTIPATRAAILLQLPRDALAIDDEVVLLPEPERRVAVADLLDGDASASLRVEALLASLPGVVRAGDADQAHVVLTPRARETKPFTTEVVIAPHGTEAASAPSTAGAASREDWTGPYLLERRHPLLAGVTLDGVIWSAGAGDAPGQALAYANDRVLIAEQVAGDAVRLRLNLDPARTNFAASPDWPVLMQNLVARARATMPGQTAANARAGERLAFRGRLAEPERGALRFVDPGGREWDALGSSLFTQEAREPGIWRLVAGSRELARWSVAFRDPAESDLTRCGGGERAARSSPVAAAGVAAGGVGRTETQALALVLLLALALDWWWCMRKGAA